MMKDWIDCGFGNMKVGNLVRLHISSKEWLEFSLVHGFGVTNEPVKITKNEAVRLAKYILMIVEED